MKKRKETVREREKERGRKGGREKKQGAGFEVEQAGLKLETTWEASNVSICLTH